MDIFFPRMFPQNSSQIIFGIECTDVLLIKTHGKRYWKNFHPKLRSLCEKKHNRASGTDSLLMELQNSVEFLPLVHFCREKEYGAFRVRHDTVS